MRLAKIRFLSVPSSRGPHEIMERIIDLDKICQVFVGSRVNHWALYISFGGNEMAICEYFSKDDAKKYFDKLVKLMCKAGKNEGFISVDLTDRKEEKPAPAEPGYRRTVDLGKLKTEDSVDE